MRPTWRGAWVPLFYVALALLASAPLFAGPYLLALDAVFGPNMDAGPVLLGATQKEGPGNLVVALVDALSRLVGVPAATRLLFVASFFGMGYGMHLLCPARHPLGKLFAGTLYVVNPFVYVRVLAGQWYVLPALAGLALSLHFVRRAARGDARAVVPLALSLALSAVMVHVAPLALGLCVLVVLAEAAASRRLPDLRRLGLALGAWLLLSAYWVLPLLLRGSPSLGSIGGADFEAFAPRSDAPTGLALDLLGLYGFWRDAYALPKDASAAWLPWTFALLFLSALGVLRGRDARPMLASLAGAGLAAAVVALLAGLAAKDDAAFPLAGLPGMGLYRDAHKLVAVLLLAYAACGGVGVGELLARAPLHDRRWVGLASVAVVAVAVLGAWPMLAGYEGQLRATDYPEDWHEAKRVIEGGPDGVVLVLPWHLYMDQSWLDQSAKRVGNPARVFLERPVLAGDTPGLVGATEGPRDPVSLYVERVVLPAGNGTSVARLLAPLHVSHVLVMKDAEWREAQAWLAEQREMDLVLDAEHVAVYRSRIATTRVYAPEAYAGLPSDAVEASRERPLHEAYLAEGGADEPLGPLRGVHEDAARLEPDADGVVVLAARQHEGNAWTWTGEPAPPHLGFLPTGDASGGGAFVLEDFWRVRLPAYVVTLAALVGVLAWDVRARRA